MSALQTVSVGVPSSILSSPGARMQLARLDGRLAAMGLGDRLPGEMGAALAAWRDPPQRAAWLLDTVRSAGIGDRLLASLGSDADPRRWTDGLERLNDLVAQSPHPRGEWPVLLDLLGGDLLLGMVGVARSSAARYRSGSRDTPEGVAARLHHLAMVVADLEGGYNSYGIRRWFARRRPQLQDRSPGAVLSGIWDPDDEEAQRVADLAAALNAATAT